MNPEYEKQLEAAVDRELKGLPELRAPEGLASRVMAAIDDQAGAAWHRQAWQTWPASVRWALLTLLLASFGALYFGTWELSHTPSFLAATHQAHGWFSTLDAVWNALAVVVSALGLVIKDLGNGVMFACLAALLFGYALLVGLGTVYVRLAFARR